MWPKGLASAQRTISIGYDEYQQPSIQRFELDPEGAFSLAAHGTIMLWVESGELEIDLSGTDQTGTVTLRQNRSRRATCGSYNPTATWPCARLEMSGLRCGR
ncbi:MAG: hypothetical protein R2848_05390 [Thermomicrobiales bacterium]